jgi:hypothetical protein
MPKHIHRISKNEVSLELEGNAKGPTLNILVNSVKGVIFQTSFPKP